MNNLLLATLAIVLSLSIISCERCKICTPQVTLIMVDETINFEEPPQEYCGESLKLLDGQTLKWEGPDDAGHPMKQLIYFDCD